MNYYGSMTVDELMSEYAEWARNRAGTHWEIHGTQGVVVDDKNPLNAVARKHAIISAIRKAVIRETSQEELFKAFSSFPCIETSKYYPDDPKETP